MIVKKCLPKKWYLILGISFVLILSLNSIWNAYLTKEIIDAAVEKDINLFLQVLIYVVALVIFDITFTYLKSKIIGTYIENRLKKYAIYSH